jgi:hypothetical protein
MGDKKKDMLSREYHTSSFVSVFMGISMQTPRLQVATLHVTFEIYGTTYIEHMICANQKVLMERPI